MSKKIDWILILILSLALVLRLPQLNGSFWLDEAAQALESARPLQDQLKISGDFQPPLIHFLAHFALYFSQSEWWLRTVTALIPGLLTIFFTYQLAKTWQFRHPWLAPLLLATNSFHIFYSQELRPYSLPAFFAVLSWWLIIKRKPLKFWAVTSLLGLYSSYLYPFLFLAQLIYLILITKLVQKTQSWWQSLAASLWRPLLVIFLLCLPWLPSFLNQLETGQLVRSELAGWSAVVATPQLKALSLVGGKFIFGLLDIEITPWFGLFSLLILFSFGFLLIKTILINFNQKVSRQRVLLSLLIWLLFPVLAAWLVSFFIPILQPKRVLYLLPGFYLLVTYLVDLKFYSNKLIVKLSKISLVFSLLLINGYATWAYFTNPELQRENWRALISELQQKYPNPNQTTAIFVYPAPFSPWVWYSNDFPTLSLGQLSTEKIPDLGTQLSAKLKTERVITFDYLTDLTDPQHQVLTQLTQNGYQPTDLLDYPLIGFVRIYEK